MWRLVCLLPALAGCIFDSAGLPYEPAPRNDQPLAIDHARRDGARLDQSRLEGGKGDRSLDTPRPDGRPDSRPPDTRPPDTRPPDKPPPKPDVPLTCAATCSGCCDSTGKCKGGGALIECGKAGAPCADCGALNQVCKAGGSCGACTASSECPAEAVCLNPGATATCVGAYGRNYTVTVVSAKILATRPDGSNWDASSIDPDVFVDIYRAGMLNDYTTTQSNTCAPVWNESFTISLPKGTALRFEVGDADSGMTYESIGTVDLKPEVPLSVLKAGVYNYTPSGASDGLQGLQITFTPK